MSGNSNHSENDIKCAINNNNNNSSSSNINTNSNDRIEWSRSTILGFIEDYRRQRVLWDPNTKGYHIKQTKYEALKSLGQKYGTEIRSIRSKIKSLRSSFHREHGKVINGRRKGIHYQPMWFAYEAIRFILVGDGQNVIDANNVDCGSGTEMSETKTNIDSSPSSQNNDRQQNDGNAFACSNSSNGIGIGCDDTDGDGGDDETKEDILFATASSHTTAAAASNSATAPGTTSSSASSPSLPQTKLLSVKGEKESNTDKINVGGGGGGVGSCEAPSSSSTSSSCETNLVASGNSLSNALNCLSGVGISTLDGFLDATKMAFFLSKGLPTSTLSSSTSTATLALTKKLETNNNNISNGIIGAAGTAFSTSHQSGLTGGVAGSSSNVGGSGIVVDDRNMARVAAVFAAAAAANANNASICSTQQSAVVIGNAASNSDLDGDLHSYCNIRAEDVKTEIIESDTTDLSILDKSRVQTPSPINFYNNNSNNNRPTDLSANSSRKRKAATNLFERYSNCNGLDDEAPSPSKLQQQHRSLAQHQMHQHQQHHQQQQQHSNIMHLKPQISIAAAAGRELSNTTNATTLIPTSSNLQLSSSTITTTPSSAKYNSNNNNSNNNNNNNSSGNNNNKIHYSNNPQNLFVNQSKELQQQQPQPQQQQSLQQQQQTDEYGIFGEYVAVTIRKLKTSKAKIVVKHLINNLLYEAELGKYDHGIPSSKEPPHLYKM